MPEEHNWNLHWEHYDQATSRNPAQLMRYKLICGLLAEEFPEAEPKVLDLGSGQGDLLRRVQERLPRAKLLGMELSESGVAISRKKVPKATFEVVDFFNPSAQTEPYRGWAEAAVCSEVLEHVDDPGALLRSAAAYLASGCRLIVTVPGGPMSAFDRYIGHRQHFNRAKISELLSANGFVVERVLLSGFPFFNLYRLMVIARGEKLAGDIDSSRRTLSSSMADAAMALFRALFVFNLRSFPLGWQVVAIARKA